MSRASEGRIPRPIGFGALFAVGLARALAETPALDLVIGEAVLKSPAPPGLCPCCGFAALGPERDPNGDWTWHCVGGCNP